MSEKRKDNKGRILRTGESQRKDGIYQYRYTDPRGKRQTVYSSDLKELREKEKTIQRDLDDHIDYAAGEITLAQLVERYLSLKQNLRYNTQKQYDSHLNLIREEEFCKRCIKEIRMSDIKMWVIDLHRRGRSYGSIQSLRSVVKSAFKMACDEDLIRKNPFDFRLCEVLENDAQERVALTLSQQQEWMDFACEDNICSKYYDELVILLGTGLRVSELCGLIKDDLDFECHRIRVERQLIRQRGGVIRVAKLKSKHGCRFIPMSDQVAKSFQNILSKRNPKTETIVDGHTGFIFLTKNETPKTSIRIERDVQCVWDRYKLARPKESFPHVTPHVLRHTFCTNMANAGMNVKSLQYVMGHSSALTTMRIYAHGDYECASKEMCKIMDLSTTQPNNVANTTPNTTPLASTST